MKLPVFVNLAQLQGTVEVLKSFVNDPSESAAVKRRALATLAKYEKLALLEPYRSQIVRGNESQ